MKPIIKQTTHLQIAAINNRQTSIKSKILKNVLKKLIKVHNSKLKLFK